MLINTKTKTKNNIAAASKQEDVSRNRRPMWYILLLEWVFDINKYVSSVAVSIR